MRKCPGLVASAALAATLLAGCGSKAYEDPVCGDDRRQGTETCDGDDLAGRSCEDFGYEEGTLACADSCTAFDTSGCTGEPCGNGSLDEGEVCDGEDLGGATCASMGFDGGTLACRDDCSGYDVTACEGEGCGNGVREGGEECDGDDLGGATCTSLGEPEGNLLCNADCTFDTSMCGCVPYCTGRECGDDGCGGSCGSCTPPETCNVFGECLCIPDCAERECGDDGCGGSCGSCTPPDTCVDGTCVCIPDCTGRECGDDGCGGSCGSCTPPDTCVDGTCACIPDCTGRECGDDPLCSVSCGTCTPPDTCVDGACVCIPDCTGRECGDDGCGGSCGSCTFPYACDPSGTCVPPIGTDCDTPFVVDPGALPWEESGDTTDALDDLHFDAGECPGVSGGRGSASNDEVYELTPDETGIYTITLSPDGGFDSALYVLADCTSPIDCLHASEIVGEEEIELALDAGDTYHIVVDGWSNESNEAGTYTLSVSAPCLPDCAGRECGGDGCGGSCGSCPVGATCNASGLCEAVLGDTCDDPFLIDARDLPVSVPGDTTDAFQHYSYSDGACPGEEYGNGAMSNDEVYMVVPVVTGTYTITVTPDSTFDSTVYVATDCDSVDATCLGADHVSGDGVPDVLEVILEAGETYYIFVDGWTDFSNSMGPYTLEMSAVCEPDCTGRECGDDGCLGSCGTCPYGERCDDSGTCVTPPTGDACPGPYIVDSTALPWSHDSSTDLAWNDYSYGDGACPGESWGAGGGSNDEAYLFVPATSDTFTFSLAADFDAALYTVTDCEDVDATCLGADEVVGAGGEILSIPLSAGESCYVIVDGWTDSSNTSGDYTLTISD